ncbi:MAG: CDGSH iron-sulfur domain-containing protein [Candidatus Eisenbacteria bacterium]|uniref:CDGSH iron-sulfur domain-containing protein n=1 Tax=Eiseniibacteriota bacterium TaxID=2212470 RepID=A0A956LYB8_UNCEI|nr:CDGSH iron-sulfur domain-containing protein [Candidatus Eisenbacteria bacterium]
MSDESRTPESSSPTIEIRENGPYLVKNLGSLQLADGTTRPTEEVFALCRCGGSANKPFCDGTHKRNGFSGARETDAALDRERLYEGSEIAIHDNRTICSHATHCTKDLPAVFRYGQKPWIDPEGADAAAIMEQIRRCPSGALSYARGGEIVRDVAREPGIEIERGGPYRVTGSIALSGDLQPPSREHYALCRCGRSRNKPFCDGTHHDVDFDV